MIIVWKGWGILVVPIVIAAFVVAFAIPASPMLIKYVLLPGAALAAAAAIWFTADFLERGEARELIDAKTGQRFLVRKSAGSLFFIGTRNWAYIMAFVGVIFLGAALAGYDTTPGSPSHRTAQTGPVAG